MWQGFTAKHEYQISNLISRFRKLARKICAWSSRTLAIVSPDSTERCHGSITYLLQDLYTNNIEHSTYMLWNVSLREHQSGPSIPELSRREGFRELCGLSWGITKRQEMLWLHLIMQSYKMESYGKSFFPFAVIYYTNYDLVFTLVLKARWDCTQKISEYNAT